ncbi:MAG: DUF86 domain-containing protein [Deltaproteobacteria bacterium]|nr:DUF86 domain-containing protein [Deltaproteobacteria bacterium]
MTKGRLDAALVRRHLLGLDRAVAQLQKHVGRPVEELVADLDVAWAMQHGLQLCAQNALDVATHIASSAGLDSPAYASSLDRLAELGLLPAPFLERFRGVEGFRNALVHGYLDVDLKRVHALLNGQLEDFRAYARYAEA